MKHAASVRPEPGSNSPLSEKLCSFVYVFRCVRPARIALATRLRLTPATHTLKLHFFVRHSLRINKFFRLIPKTVFSYSIVNVQMFRLVHLCLT